MEVQLPSRFNTDTMCSLINKVIDDNYAPVSQEIIFDFRTLNFIRPVGVTILSNLIEWLKIRGVKIRVVYPTEFSYKYSPIGFLDDSLFFKQYLGKKISEFSAPRETTIPLKLVSYQESYYWLEENFIYWLGARLSLSVRSLEEIKVCLFEIFNNIHDHSEEQIGSVFCQHFPQENQVNIAISDFGVGIPPNVRKVIPEISDHRAIAEAIEEGFTTKSTVRNAGAGLDILISNVVMNNRGSVGIFSNHGRVNCSYNDGEIQKIPSELRGYYPGTLLDIHLRTDTIERIDDSPEDFEW